MNRFLLREGVRIAWHGLTTSLFGHEVYDGSAEEICRQIVEACWNGTFFQTSLHNYPLFYARDFGMCVDSLLALGQEARVRRTLAWALRQYEQNGKLTLILDRKGHGFNFPDTEAPDAYAFLLHSLLRLGDGTLVARYRAFLEGALLRFAEAVLEKKTGLCQPHLRLGGMRDYALRKSSCYDNVMLAVIKQSAGQLNLANPFSRYNYVKLILDYFWTGESFKDDMENDAPTGDANVVPFWFRIFPPRVERRLFLRVRRTIARLRLDKPVPLRYEPTRQTRTAMHWLELLTGGWERDTAWLHLGNLYLQVLARLDPEGARTLLAAQRRLIEQHRCYPEVVDTNGELHRSLFFHADGSMLWAANFLALNRRFKEIG